VVGFGLVPRGEVTLIFASLGKSMGILSTSHYSVLIIVVLLTTLITPPCLTWAVGGKAAAAAPGSSPGFD
jgi:Kef-type K+ transport system membrane component KefB